MQAVLNFLIRLFLVGAGLVFAASLAFAFVLMLAAWGVRAGWGRLTGRPVTPFVMRIDPLDGFERMYRRSHAATPRPGTQERRPGEGRRADVTDVVAKEPRG